MSRPTTTDPIPPWEARREDIRRNGIKDPIPIDYGRDPPRKRVDREAGVGPLPDLWVGLGHIVGDIGPHALGRGGPRVGNPDLEAVPDVVGRAVQAGVDVRVLESNL